MAHHPSRSSWHGVRGGEVGLCRGSLLCLSLATRWPGCFRATSDLIAHAIPQAWSTCHWRVCASRSGGPPLPSRGHSIHVAVSTIRGSPRSLVPAPIYAFMHRHDKFRQLSILSYWPYFLSHVHHCDCGMTNLPQLQAHKANSLPLHGRSSTYNIHT